MKFRHGWLLKTAAVAVIVWMASNAALAQLSTQNLPGTFTQKGGLQQERQHQRCSCDAVENRNDAGRNDHRHRHVS